MFLQLVPIVFVWVQYPQPRQLTSRMYITVILINVERNFIFLISFSSIPQKTALPWLDSDRSYNEKLTISTINNYFLK